MNNKEFRLDLENRTKRFAIQIIRLSSSLPKSSEGRIIRNQITKSATSIGANYREANRAKSRADFRYKMKICEGEASETVYWLELIDELNWANQKTLKGLIQEAGELLAIFTSAGKKLKNKKKL